MWKLFSGGAFVVVSAMVACFGWDAGSYLSTAWQNTRREVKERVPILFELDRARDQLAKLDPDIQRSQLGVAAEAVAIERLEQQAIAMDQDLAQQKRRLLHLREQIQSGRSAFNYSGRIYDAADLKSDLQDRWQRFLTQSDTLAKLREAIAARQQALATTNKTIVAMKAARQQLAVEVENLQARERLVELAAVTTPATIDQSQLARIRKLLDDIDVRISTSEHLLAMNSRAEAIPINADDNDNVIDEVAAYFAPHTAVVSAITHEVPSTDSIEQAAVEQSPIVMPRDAEWDSQAVPPTELREPARPSSPLRGWTNSCGCCLAYGSLVGMSGNCVEIKKRDGRISKIQLSRFCWADQQFILTSLSGQRQTSAAPR